MRPRIEAREACCSKLPQKERVQSSSSFVLVVNDGFDAGDDDEEEVRMVHA